MLPLLFAFFVYDASAANCFKKVILPLVGDYITRPLPEKIILTQAFIDEVNSRLKDGRAKSDTSEKMSHVELAEKLSITEPELYYILKGRTQKLHRDRFEIMIKALQIHEDKAFDLISGWNKTPVKLKQDYDYFTDPKLIEIAKKLPKRVKTTPDWCELLTKTLKEKSLTKTKVAEEFGWGLSHFTDLVNGKVDTIDRIRLIRLMQYLSIEPHIYLATLNQGL
jgi:predicted XRE-type DNA-binding protein